MSRDEPLIFDEPPNPHSDDLARSCEEKARAAGKLEEYMAALATYAQHIPNRGALVLMALARVGVDVAALETLFLLREQEDRERLDRAMKGLAESFGHTRGVPRLDYWPPPGVGSYFRDVLKERMSHPMMAIPPSDSIVQAAKEWEAEGYPSPVPDAIEAMRTAGASARDFADNLIQQSLTKKTP